jgi:hypothetical protein
MSENRADRLKPLARVLIFKIAFTALFWCAPLLTFPSQWFLAVGFPEPEPTVFVRLLGAAYLALLVGYAFGLAQARRGSKPAGVVWMGTVSNGLGSAILFWRGLAGDWNAWGRPSAAMMWSWAVVTLGITFGLLYYGRPWAQDDALSEL